MDLGDLPGWLHIRVFLLRQNRPGCWYPGSTTACTGLPLRLTSPCATTWTGKPAGYASVTVTVAAKRAAACYDGWQYVKLK
jgi:hypothetical protein